MNTLKISSHRDIFTLIQNAESIEFDLPVVDLSRLVNELTDNRGSLSCRVVGKTNSQKHLLLHVQIFGVLNMICQRCLEPLVFDVSVDNMLHFVRLEEELDSEEDELNAILAGSNAPEKILGSDEFDLLGLLEDELILSIPVANVHEVCSQQLPTSSGKKASAFDVLSKLK